MKIWLIFILALAFGCASTEKPSTTIIVPSAATSAPEYRGDGTMPAQRYVVRMSDGERDWEVEFPETASGYEIRIPLEAQKTKGVTWQSDNLTDADRKILERERRMNPGMERDGIFVGGENLADGSAEPGAELDENGQPVESREVGRVNEDAASPTRPSYLLGIDEVQELFQAGKFELAMVRVTELEKAYPNDAKLLSMMGTLWLQLGRRELARETWERVLQIDPENRAVIEALRQLNGE